jgi:hypothetical protein
VVSQLGRLLELDHPLAYCDACVALRLEISFEDAKAGAIALAERPGFVRKERECDSCTRIVELTCLGVRFRR